MTVKHLVSALQIVFTPEQKRNLEMISYHITDVKLRDYIKYGIGYHHAGRAIDYLENNCHIIICSVTEGMIPETRQIIEETFRNGHLPVLVCTSTLAMGVNLPAHLIIIKSTKTYVNCEYRDYTEIAIQQMIGRAGRPQYDTNATAIILTTDEDKVSAKFRSIWIFQDLLYYYPSLKLLIEFSLNYEFLICMQLLSLLKLFKH